MPTEAPDIKSLISILVENFEATFARGNSVEIADFYTESGMLLPTGSDFIEGRQGIAEYWQVAIDMGITNAKLDVVEIEQHDDTAIEMSRYTLSAKDGSVVDHGKGIVIWKFEGGAWKMHRDIWNSSIRQA